MVDQKGDLDTRGDCKPSAWIPVTNTLRLWTERHHRQLFLRNSGSRFRAVASVGFNVSPPSRRIPCSLPCRFGRRALAPKRDRRKSSRHRADLDVVVAGLLTFASCDMSHGTVDWKTTVLGTSIGPRRHFDVPASISDLKGGMERRS